MHDIFGFLMTIFFSVCYLPQIFKIYWRRSSTDISVTTYYLTLLGYISGLLYVRGIDSFWLNLNYYAGLVSCIITIGLYYKYKWPKLPKQRRATPLERRIADDVFRKNFKKNE
jgi:hypothetical protein